MPFPEIWQDVYRQLSVDHTDGDEVLVVLDQAIITPLQRVHDRIVDTPRLLSFDTDDNYVNFLCNMLGWPISQSWPTYIQRNVLKKIADWKRHMGSEQVIVEVFEEYTRPSALAPGIIVDVSVQPDINGGARTGKARTGKARTFRSFSRFDTAVITITNLNGQTMTPELLRQLSAIADIIIDADMSYTIVVP